MVCHLRSNKIRFFILCVLLVMVISCKKDEQTSSAPPVKPQQKELATTAVLVTFAGDERPTAGESGQKQAQQSASKQRTAAQKQSMDFYVEMHKSGLGVAYIAKVGNKLRVVHNGKPGKLYGDIDASTLSLSPDGHHVGYGASNDPRGGGSSGMGSGVKWLLVHDSREEGPFDNLGPPVFSPDGQHVAFECKTGDRWKMCVDGKPYGDAFSYIDKPVFSADSKLLWFGESADKNRNPRLIVSDLSFKEQRLIDLSGGPYAVSGDLSRVAAMQEAGKQKRVVEFDISLSGKLKEGVLYDEVKSLVFSADGKALAYLGKKGEATFLVLDGREERLPTGEYPWPPVIMPGNKGAGIAIVAQDGAYLHQAFVSGAQSPNRYKEIADVVYSRDGKSHAYVAIKNERFIIVVNDKEGPVYDRVITPQFSPDGKYLVYRARQDGKRFVVIADATGEVIREHSRYERVFETMFTNDGNSVAYGVVDGKQIIWKVEKL